MAKKSSGSVASASKQKSLSGKSIASWNKWLALIFAVQGVAILLFSEVRSYPVTLNYLGLDTLQTNAQGKAVYATGSQVWFNLNLAWVVGAFLLIAAIGYGLFASRLQEYYERGLERHYNLSRWELYSISGSVMMLAISLIAGVQDVGSLLMIMGLTALAAKLAIVCERINQNGKIRWALFIASCAAGGLAWLVLLIYLISGAVYGSVPAYVYWITAFAFVMSACVAGNFYLQLRGLDRWKDWLYGERMYPVLSLVSKTFVAWLIYAAILRP